MKEGGSAQGPPFVLAGTLPTARFIPSMVYDRSTRQVPCLRKLVATAVQSGRKMSSFSTRSPWLQYLLYSHFGPDRNHRFLKGPSSGFAAWIAGIW